MTDWDKNSTGDSIRDSIHESIHRDIHDRINTRSRSCGDQGGYHGIIWGGAVCLLGVFLLLDHLG